MLDREIIRAARILIVDDQPANIILLERALQQGGYTDICKTTDPRKVLELFSVYKPDVVLLDLMMPNVDGFSLLKQLRSRIPDGHYLPILVLTADATPNAKRNALSLGAKDFLAKPFDVVEIVLRVNNLVETRWLYVELQERIAMMEERNAPEAAAAQERASASGVH